MLAGQDDPYQQLYRDPAAHGVPKQSINVNPNAPDEEGEDYLVYDLVPLDKPEWSRRFRVALDELYLKTLILRPKPVAGRLPFLHQAQSTLDSPRPQLGRYAFIRKKTLDGTPYRTLLYFENDQLHFADLRDPEQRRQKLYPLMERLGLEWEQDVIEPLLRKRHKEEKGEEELSRYDFILGPNQVIEIEDTKEDVLYDYEEIARRKDELEEPFPVEALKLAPYYDQLKPQSYPTLAELQTHQFGLWQDGPVQHEEAKAFLARLEQYDAFLEEVGQQRATLSYRELTSSPLLERVAAIFGLQRASGKVHRGKLKSLYQERDMFLSEKARQVHLYQGIWYDDELCYMVGDRQALNMQQPVAHLLRRFDVYQGKNQFDVHQWLDTVTVPFVRPERYTVFPYFFHLLDLYVESYLVFGTELSADDPDRDD